MEEKSIISLDLLNYFQQKDGTCSNNNNNQTNEQDQDNSPKTSSSLTMIPQTSDNFSSALTAAAAEAQFTSLLSSGLQCGSLLLLNEQQQPCFEAASPEASEDNISQGLITSRDHLEDNEDFSDFCNIEQRILAWLENEGIEHVLPSEKIEKYFDEKRKMVSSQNFTPIHQQIQRQQKQKSGSIDCLTIGNNKNKNVPAFMEPKMSLPEKLDHVIISEDVIPQTPNKLSLSTSLWHRRKQQAQTAVAAVHTPQSCNDLEELNKYPQELLPFSLMDL